MYLPLNVDPGAPSQVRVFIAEHVDMQFHDVHCMLRLPMTARGLRAGCNFAAASTLLGLVSGASVMLYAPERFHDDEGRELLFKGVLRDAYPWLNRKPAVPPEEAANKLWQMYRCPFAHSLGVLRPKGQWSKVLKPGQGMAERDVAALEKPGQRPRDLPPTMIKAGSTYKLNVHSLYWGTRRMFETLTEDASRMRRAAKLLDDLGRKSTPSATYTLRSSEPSGKFLRSSVFSPSAQFKKRDPC